MKLFIRMNIIALLITFVVVVLGAYVRLSGAGLACPDWPGCYGHVGVPSDPELKEKLGKEYNLKVEEGKAWKEMIHRYIASFLGIWVIIMAAVAWRERRSGNYAPLGIAIGLVILTGMQGALGAFTVTELVSPSIVSMHLMGGMSVLGVLLWQLCYVHQRNKLVTTDFLRIRPLVLVGFFILCVQIFLGAWTSTNYAAWTVCNDFPTCDGKLWPEMEFWEAFTLWKELGINYMHYENHVSLESKRAIQVVHRIGALITFLYLASVSIVILLKRISGLRRRALLLVAALLLQLTIGILTATGWYGNRMFMAVSHNGGAALLLMTMILLLAPLYARRKS